MHVEFSDNQETILLPIYVLDNHGGRENGKEYYNSRANDGIVG